MTSNCLLFLREKSLNKDFVSPIGAIDWKTTGPKEHIDEEHFQKSASQEKKRDVLP